MTPHETTVHLATEANHSLAALFRAMGSVEHPDGAIVRAYRVAIRALAGGAEPADVLAELRASLARTAKELLGRAEVLGVELGTAQLAAYGLEGGEAGVPSLLSPWMADVDAQLRAVRALFALGAALALIIGESGVLTPGPILISGSRWLAETFQAAYRGRIGSPDGWMHQAVAAIDARTTECCKRVHGQVQPINRAFQLTGRPRYADALPHPPFHRFCRTAEALVSVEDAGDEVTQRMIREGSAP